MPSVPGPGESVPGVGSAFLGRERGSCEHRMRVVGYVPVAERSRADCEQPLRAVCRDCDHSEVWRCDSYGCGPCGETKRRRLQRVIEDGAAGHAISGLRGYFLTLTAPGTGDHRRWVQGKPRGRRTECSCHRHGMSAGQWNAQESASWNRLRTSLARDRTLIYAGAVETQKRGMLHRHLVVFVSEDLGFDEVQNLALAAGYGCVLDIEPLQSAQKAGRYLSKYVTKSTGERPEVAWSVVKVDQDTGELVDRAAPATFRLWSASHSWGVTMKQIKDTARAQASARARYLRELEELLDPGDGDRDSASGPALATSGAPPPV